VDILEIVNAENDLFDMVGTLHSACRFTGRLNGRQQQADQNNDDQ